MVRKQTKSKLFCDDQVNVIRGRLFLLFLLYILLFLSNIFNFDVLCSLPHQRMFVDRYPIYSCINSVNVALVWQLLIFPLSGKCSIVVQT